MNEKSENRKALPKFFLTLLIAGLVGGFIGFFVGLGDRRGLGSAVVAQAARILQIVTPWAIPAATAVTMGSNFFLYRSAKRCCAAWSGGDEDDAAEVVDRRLNWILLLSSVQILLDLFFFSAAVCYELPGMLYHVAAFLLSGGLTIFAQQKVVDLTRRMNPEKKGSVYDTKFQKKWLASCDEAERQQIGQAAFHAYSLTSRACIFIWAALLVMNIAFGFGIMPSFVAVVIAAVLQVSYMLECIRMENTPHGPGWRR